MTRIQAVFFDVGGTLLLPESVGHVYARIARKYGARDEPEELAARFRRAFARQEEIDRQHGWRTDHDRERRRWRDIVTETLPEAADEPDCFEELYRHYAQGRAWTLAEGAAELLEVCRARGLVVGLASNYDERLHEVLEGHPLLCDLRHRIISAEIGWRKPAAEFFDGLTARTGLPAGCILHVGDDRLSDFEGALAAGLQAILLDPNGKNADLGTGRIGDLGALANRLDGDGSGKPGRVTG